MNRELKFRQAGFNRDGSFREWHHWGFISEGRFVGVELGISTHQQAIVHTYQYIGLKDKNGKEIYEGDIVSSGKWIAQVVYGRYGWTITPNPTKQRNEVVLVNLNTILEVIGNIYENPELLEGAVRWIENLNLEYGIIHYKECFTAILKKMPPFGEPKLGALCSERLSTRS